MTRYYAGIGARDTPADIQALMRHIARKLGELGYVLRSGGARGADTAFEQGAKGLPMEIYLPSLGYRGHPSPLYGVTEEALALAARHHPNWARLSPDARLLMARNGYQILGQDLRTPSAFVVCWTPDGAVSFKERSRATGGTGQAIAIASAQEPPIPVFNLARDDHRQRLETFAA